MERTSPKVTYIHFEISNTFQGTYKRWNFTAKRLKINLKMRLIGFINGHALETMDWELGRAFYVAF